ncbi:MAG: FIST C-terminal domain-containing protein [Chitinophagaceae bacterium]|nr:FIST C-terminal domain-containing protein [Chitinophagaceae bacterium]
MKTAIYSWNNHYLERHPLSKPLDEQHAQLVLCFGAKQVLESIAVFELLKDKFPRAVVAICSTAGEIYHTGVLDHTLSITALQFDCTSVKPFTVDIDAFSNSYEAGSSLFEQFDPAGLSYLLVLSDGSKVNGSELVRGINHVNKQQVLVTGGLAGDGSDFQSTWVGINETPRQGVIAGIGFYGKKLRVRHGSMGGWETFGLEKKVTKSAGNILYEIEYLNALDIYKEYLGPEAESLPGSALLFPLAVKLPGIEEPVVRTILSIDDHEGSMKFAGDIPVGSKVRFMKANFDKLTNAASGAASQTCSSNEDAPSFALLISCVGRKLILQSRTEEEVEAVDEIFDHRTVLSGFYSYGEISPQVLAGGCQLHNQTMTITTFHEVQ